MEAKQKEFLKYIGGMVLFVCFVWKYELVFRMVGWVYRMISPLIYGFVIAFILNLLVRKIEKCMTGRMWQNQTVKRCISIILSVVIAVGVITAVLAGLIPEIVNSAKVLQEKLPAVLQNVAAWMEENFHMSGNILDEMQKFKFDPAMLDDILQNDTVISVLKTGGNVIGKIISGFAGFTIGLVFAFYVLVQKEELGNKIKRLLYNYLPEKKADQILHFFRRADEVYSGFISGQCMDAVILGCMVSVGMLILRISYPVLMGVIIAVTALIPVVGAFVGGGIGMFLIAMESPLQSVLCLILVLVLQQIDNKIIYPHVVGSAVGLPSIWIFAAIIVGGNISGVLGMFLGIPVAALVYAFLGEDLHRRERKKEEERRREEQEEEQGREARQEEKLE